MTEDNRSRTRKVLDHLGLYSLGDWLGLLLLVVLGLYLAFIAAAWWWKA